MQEQNQIDILLYISWKLVLISNMLIRKISYAGICYCQEEICAKLCFILTDHPPLRPIAGPENLGKYHNIFSLRHTPILSL